MRRKFLLSNFFKFFLPILLVLFSLINCHKFLAPVVTVAINDTEGAPSDTIVVPIHTSRVTNLNIVSCDVCLSFNDSILSAVRVVAGDVVPSGWSIESRSSPELVITMDGTEPFKGDGILANMYFVVSDKASPGDTCTLRLQRCEFNKGKILSSLASGLFRVTQKYYGISGYVRQSDGTPIDDVMMVLSGDASDTIYIDSVGYYEFSLTGGDYTVTPNKLYWEFEPSERNYAPLETTQGNHNYIGKPIAPLTVWVPDTSGISRDTVNIPINVDDVAGLNVVTCDITLSFDANILTALDASLGALSSGWLIESHSTPGQIVIAMAGTTSLSGSGSLVNIPFVVSSAASSGDTTAIHFVSCSFNEGTVPANTYDGLFAVDTEYYSVSGYVRKSDAAPIANVMMILSGHASDTVYTDVSGYYEFSGLVTGNYTIRPDKLAWVFKPDSTAYMSLDTNQTDQNYIGTPVPSVTIWIPDTSGASDDTLVVSVNVPDVTGWSIVSCDITITFNANILTALYASVGDIVPGDWRINNFSTPGQIIIAMTGTTPLSEGGSLVTIPCVVSTAVLPDDTTTMHFASCSFNEGAIPADTHDGLFTVIERLYSISGYVKDVADTPIDGVMMILTGNTLDTVYTDVSGYYEFSGLVTGDYTVTPSKQDWVFDPGHRDYKPLNSDQTNQNYTGIIYSISGYVRSREGTPIDNVMMVLSGDTADTVYTDVSGYYEFSGLITGDYTIAPSKQGWIFDPSHRDYMPLNSDQTDQNYTGISVYSISGYVRSREGTPIDNVIMVLSGDTADTVYTDVSGYYEFSGLVTGDYTITPSKQGWVFDPGHRDYMPLDSDQTDQNYTGMPVYSISGYVRSREGTPIDNVIMVLSGDTTGAIYTDVSGYYEFSGLVTGNYTVTPSKIGWTFEPAYREYVSLNANSTDRNFTGAPVTLSISDTYGTPGDTIIVPIRITDVTGFRLTDCDITLTFDANILKALPASVGDIVPADWLINSFVTPGQIVIAMAGTTPLSGSGNLVLIPFIVSETASPGDTTAIHFLSCLLNEGDIPSDTQDGPFTVTAYSISGYVKQSDYTPIADVMMILSGDISDTVYTSDIGYYEFFNLPSGNYTVTPTKNGWTFEPAYIEYVSLGANQTSQNYTGTPIPSVRLWIPDTSGTPGDTVIIPISVGDVEGRDIISCNITIAYDANILTTLNASLGDIVPTNWLIQSHTTPGQIVIAISGTTPLSDAGNLVTIPFVVSQTALPGNTSALHFLSCLLKEGIVPSYTEDGLFTVVAKRYSISGYVRTPEDGPVGNVRMTLFGDTADTMYTNVSGYYEFDELLAGNYTVTPTKLTWRFEPDHRDYTPLNSNRIDQNYIGIPIPPVNVWIPDTSGSPPDTVAVPIRIGDVAGRDVVACDIAITFDANILTALDASLGDAVPAGWSIVSHPSVGQITIEMTGTISLNESGNLAMIPFVISMSAPEGATSPMHFANCVFNEGNVPVNTNDGLFMFSPIYYSISGYVKKEDDTPIENVPMILSGYASDTVYTDNNGYYEITKLFRGAYTVTPRKSGWRFDPGNRAYFPLDTSSINQNYTAIQLTYDIKGEIKDTVGNPLWNVKLVLAGAASDIQYTDEQGRYKFQDLLYGHYTVTPEKCGWIFEPDHRDYAPLSANLMGQDYTGILITPVDVWLPDTTEGAPGDTVDVPIYIGDVTNLKVTEIDIKLTFDKNNLAALDAYLGDICPDGWQLESYPNAGQMTIAMTGTNPISGEGIIAIARFVVSISATPSQLINVHFERCEFNEGCVPTNPIDGVIEVVP